MSDEVKMDGRVMVSVERGDDGFTFVNLWLDDVKYDVSEAPGILSDAKVQECVEVIEHLREMKNHDRQVPS